MPAAAGGTPALLRYHRAVRNFALIALTAFACTEAPTVQTATATRRALSVPILADGTLEPPPGGEVRAPEAAVIGPVLVRDRQRLPRGARIVPLDNPAP